MDNATREIVAQWIRKADSDLLNIRNNLAADDVPTDTICFHAQQAIEKLLKALLIANGRDITKTHDLVKLLTDAADIATELLQYEEQMEEISEYGVAIRYPDGICDPTMEEASHAYEIAVTVRELIIGKL